MHCAAFELAPDNSLNVGSTWIDFEYVYRIHGIALLTSSPNPWQGSYVPDPLLADTCQLFCVGLCFG